MRDAAVTIHYWDEDKLEPRVGYMMLTRDGAMVPVKDMPAISPRVGDILHITIIASAEAERAEEDEA